MTNTSDRLLLPRGAQLSPCGAYRYRLWRRWDTSTLPVTFIMLNPSTADAEKDDPTIRKCCKFARRWGYGGIEVVNLFALRATSPRALYRSPHPIGEHNDDAIVDRSRASALVVCAWGNHGKLLQRSHDVLKLLREHSYVAHALRVTRQNQPGHPLYLRDDIVPFLWDIRNSNWSSPDG